MKLTEKQRVTDAMARALIELGRHDLPWLPSSRSMALICRRLEKMGLAQYRQGYPVGFYITTAGRALLAEEKRDA